MDEGDSEDAVFWTAFLTGLKDRGLSGVNLVISDAHRGLQASIRRTMQGLGGLRCRVHLLRNILAHLPRGQAEMVAAFVRTIFAQPDADTASHQLREVATRLERSLPKAAAVLADAEDDVAAFATFPRHPWRKIWSTNPLERVNKETGRRTNVVEDLTGIHHSTGRCPRLLALTLKSSRMRSTKDSALSDSECEWV